MPPEPEWRRELEAYSRRHESDRFAHAPLVERASESGLSFRVETDGRLNALERWQQRIIGGLLFASVLLGSGAVVGVIEFARH